MNSLEEGLRAQLESAQAIKDAVDERIYPHTAPKDTEFPCIVYERTSTDTPVIDFQGEGMKHVHFIIASVASSWHAAKQLHDDVVAALPPTTRLLGDFPIDSVHVIDERDGGKDQVQAIWEHDLEVEIIHQ